LKLDRSKFPWRLKQVTRQNHDVKVISRQIGQQVNLQTRKKKKKKKEKKREKEGKNHEDCD
jgi:hypothetical protein